MSEVYHEESLRAGRPAETQTLIPYGFRIDPQFRPLSPDERAALRRKLGLPADRPVMLSVGAVNRSHKRMDYVVREVGTLPCRVRSFSCSARRDHENPRWSWNWLTNYSARTASGRRTVPADSDHAITTACRRLRAGIADGGVRPSAGRGSRPRSALPGRRPSGTHGLCWASMGIMPTSTALGSLTRAARSGPGRGERP